MSGFSDPVIIKFCRTPATIMIVLYSLIHMCNNLFRLERLKFKSISAHLALYFDLSNFGNGNSYAKHGRRQNCPDLLRSFHVSTFHLNCFNSFQQNYCCLHLSQQKRKRIRAIFLSTRHIKIYRG